jgi:FkbH-like protein
MLASQLSWLPNNPAWRDDFRSVAADDDADFDALSRLAGFQIDFLCTERLDTLAQRKLRAIPPAQLPDPPIRLAILGSSTISYLVPAIRVGLLRRRLWAQVHVTPYGQYLQELLDPGSDLHKFRPTVILFAFDARHVIGLPAAGMSRAEADSLIEEKATHYAELWDRAQQAFSCRVIQQTMLPVFPELLGNNEHRLPGSPQRMVARFNQCMRELADGRRVDVLAIDNRVQRDGIGLWHEPALWHKGKIEIAPAMVPLYGDLVARIVAAQCGRSHKCLVLDLDNTLWGGVVGDDGVEGLVLGQGNAAGEAFVEFQRYVQQLSARGVILAVCSKNEEKAALEPFSRHPEMVLKRPAFAAFLANWTDKATNLRHIAERLNIGLDSLVFADDSPFERNLVRRELPMVAVPELPEDPAEYAQCLADAGYFEGIGLTAEDLSRADQYRANAERETLRTSMADLPSYLKSLEMEMIAGPFDRLSQTRITQLINKTNQFNLTTRRYSEREVAEAMERADVVTLQVRLTDKFGDNGIIAVVIGKPSGAGLLIDTWLMSCRVLGRQVEQATLNLLVKEARRRGHKALIGEFRPTQKNIIVRDHYKKLGFTRQDCDESGNSLWQLPIDQFVPFDTLITIAGMPA